MPNWKVFCFVNTLILVSFLVSNVHQQFSLLFFSLLLSENLLRAKISTPNGEHGTSNSKPLRSLSPSMKDSSLWSYSLMGRLPGHRQAWLPLGYLPGTRQFPCKSREFGHRLDKLRQRLSANLKNKESCAQIHLSKQNTDESVTGLEVLSLVLRDWWETKWDLKILKHVRKTWMPIESAPTGYSLHFYAGVVFQF